MATEQELRAAMAASIEKMLPKELADQFAAKGVPSLQAVIHLQRDVQYTGGVPPQDDYALPNPYKKHPPTLGDDITKEQLVIALNGFRLHNWTHAKEALENYLRGTGADYVIKPDELMEDIPSFAATVIEFVAQQVGKESFDSQWQNAGSDIRDANGAYLGQLNNDWYYTMHDWRYRIQGHKDPGGSGNLNYTVEVYKPYIFHPYSPDIKLPHTGIVIHQADMADLAIAEGMAKEFAIKGQADFTYTVTAAKPGGKADSSK
jgi:hypothetical protein